MTVEIGGMLLRRARRRTGFVSTAVAVVAFIAPGCDKRSTEPNPSDHAPSETKISEPAQSNPGSDPVSQGIAQAESGDNAAALTSLTQAIKAAPSDSEPLVWRAYVYIKIGKLRSAIADLNRAIELNPDNGEAYDERAIALAAGGAVPSAIADLNKAIKLRPQFAKLYINRGLLFQQLKQFEKAESDFEEAHRLIPLNGVPFEKLGRLFFDEGKLGAAVAEFDEAARLSPDIVDIYFNRATVNGLLHHSEKAVADYDEAIRRDPRFVKAYKGRAAIYFDEGRADDARRDLAKAQELEHAGMAGHEANGARNP